MQDKRNEIIDKFLQLADSTSVFASSVANETSQAVKAGLSRTLQHTGVVGEDRFEATISRLEARIAALEAYTGVNVKDPSAPKPSADHHDTTNSTKQTRA